MEQNGITTLLNQARAKYAHFLKLANDVLNTKPVNADEYARAINGLNEAEKEYASNAAIAMYDEYKKAENPIVEIVKAYSYVTIGHKEQRNKEDNNRIYRVDPVEKERQIDLLAFCKRAGLDTDWQYTASKFNQLMCLRTAKDLGADVKEIAKTYYLKEAVQKIDMGATPTSNTQMCKILQRIVDEMLPNFDEEGATIYKVNNYDVKYLDALYGKKSNAAILTVRVSNDSFLRRILLDICYRLVTDGKYGVDGFKVAKTK